MHEVCGEILATHGGNINTLLDVGGLFFNFGFLGEACKCFQRVRDLAPDDYRPVVNLANLAREKGEHAKSRQLYAELLQRLPNHPMVRRNGLVSLEYDADATESERFAQARDWGMWAVAHAGGPYQRPQIRPLQNRPLRVGYVSADFCQHTVGLFVKNVLAAHNPERVLAFAYSAGTVADWVTDEIRKVCTFRDVTALDDPALVNLIRQDAIDVLVDLSGHTAGSRLTIFAYRPAPVQVSWLGYFATTGLACMDALFLDEWHAPSGMENQFVEPILRLPGGRLCYQPVPWASPVSDAPFLKRGHITFGCFNNTSKFNERGIDVWAATLRAVKDSHLVLKWRNFNDEGLRQTITTAFAHRGIDAARLDLRGPSFHVDLLNEYADIDIALDPFPFTGGLTSCEALWMGVPVVTWPQTRVVSRQTFAFLSALGLPELAAIDANDYVRIAVELANDLPRLKHLRSTLRERMKASSLCDVSGFTRTFEDALIQLTHDIASQQAIAQSLPMPPKILLNVGAGHPKSGAKIPDVFHVPDWQEVRLDIDPVNEPHILGTMLDMSAVADESVEAVYSSHNIEHLYPEEIPVALKEFLRVLKPEGFVVITCPDLQAAARMISEDKLMETAYTSPAGPVTPFDIVFSHRNFTGRDKPFMAHHSGFTLSVLLGTLKANGFPSAAGMRRPAAFDLWVVASKKILSDGNMRELAAKVLRRL